jgi:protein phosphatase 1 regulatory subunit 16A
MANNGITQEFINERRNQPEIDMLSDMKEKHKQGELLNYRYSDGSTYLHIAAAYGYSSVAAFLLRCGVETSLRDNDLWLPIHAAANWNQPELIELLCEYGAEINAMTAIGETPMG